MSVRVSALGRPVLGALAMAGAGLFLAAGLRGSVLLAVAGLGCWSLVALGLLLGIRQRIGSAISMSEQLSGEIASQCEATAELRRFVAAGLSRQRERHIRMSEKVLHLRRSAEARNLVVLEALGKLEAEQRDRGSAGDRALADVRRSVTDSHTLVLRAFQDLSDRLDHVEAVAAGGQADGEAGELPDDGLGDRFDALSKDVQAGLGAVMAEVRARLQELEHVQHGEGGASADDDQPVQEPGQSGEDWIRHEMQQVEALKTLRELLDLKEPVSPLGGWAVEPGFMLDLVRRVLDAPPELVVECGSGASTVWLARALEVAGKGRLVALEHDRGHAAKVRELLERHGVSHVARVVDAPLQDGEFDGAAAPWYAAAEAQEPEGVGLLLVDGPRGAGAMARHPALAVFAPRLVEGAIVAISDHDREESREMVRRWRQDHPRLGVPRTVSAHAALFAWESA